MTTLPAIDELTMEFCSSGQKSDISKSSTADLSFQNGLGKSYSQPSGKYISRSDMNAIGNLMTKDQVFLAFGGTFTFNQALSDVIGGYPVNAILSWYYFGNVYLVESVIENNTYNFVTNPEYVDNSKWRVVSAVGVPAKWKNPDYSTRTSVKIDKTDGYTAEDYVQIVAPSGNAYMKAFDASDWININRGTGKFIYYLTVGDSIRFSSTVTCSITICK